MKRIIITIIFVIAVNAVFSQTYNMKVKQGTGSTYSVTSTVDEITFLNTTTTPFACGDVILYGGETYPTVLIGSQCWFQKNLNIGTRIDGSSNQTNNGGNNIIEKYCYDDLDASCTTYGGLYQWDEAMQYSTTEGVQGICPPGWHIPTSAEFQTLITTVGGNENGNALKAIGQGSGDGAGTNTSGFSALLAGISYANGSFSNLGNNTYFWSSTISYNLAYNLILSNGNSYISLMENNETNGISVRCLKDD